ncbi:MAG: hypothetical protein AVDCRST_MAG91-862 [uncultured Sphingomonadaceae bacterium]|uniref:Glycosyltransferase RgtA/B/C/D-like domain-containing protein n=1 Tax=uncultured Sphingomonadaceae bacterium TaxID=169976 RepID=A0A6J4SLZ0_9SPHN|nr:MAG: hypothetical protein AVDCRST_MAG91-862 [uncultured Sphingomonadaceae bacterium]
MSDIQTTAKAWVARVPASNKLMNRSWSELATGRLAIALIVLLGIAERALWNLLRPTAGAVGEAPNVAVALAQGRGFADAYNIGQGSTAHLLPVSPALAAGVYSVFGVRSPAAEFILAAWSIGLAIGTYLLLHRAFGRLGTPAWARVGALAFACLMPVYISQEAVDFRIWEGGLAVFLMALFLERLIAALERPVVATADILPLTALAALIFFVNPTLGLGVYASAGLACLTRLRIRRLITTTALAAGLAALLVVPWTLRNHHVMGSAISLRSNAGLELAIANYPGADAETEPRARYFERLEAIHPTWSERAYQEVLSVGEVAYFRRLGEQTNRWMRENPATVLKLAIGHLRQVFAPEPWQFRTFGNPAFAGGKAALATLAGLGGLLGMALALARRRCCWVHPALLVAVPALLLCLFQPVPRYTYLFYPLLVFCAADAVAQIKRMVFSKARRQPTSI